MVPKSNTTEEQAEGKVELLPNAAASKQAQVQLEEAATKVYVRKFPEKTDNILQAEVATYVCKCAPYRFYFCNPATYTDPCFSFRYTDRTQNTW